MASKRNALGPLGRARIQEGLESLHRARSPETANHTIGEVGWPSAERRFPLFLGPLTEVSTGWPANQHEGQQPVELEEDIVIDLRDPADLIGILPSPRVSSSTS